MTYFMPPDPDILFATAQDKVRIAYSVSGQGPVIVKAANWLSQIDFDSYNLVWKHWIDDISRQHTLVRYDERGCGLSDRTVADQSFEAWVNDLEAVVEEIGLERFPLLGISQGGAVAITYALRHPDRVSHLILYGAYGRGRLIRDPSAEAYEEAAVIRDMIKLGWDKEQDTFRHFFSSQFMPSANLDQLKAFNQLARMSCSAESAAQFMDVFNQIDVMELASHVQCPTLVMHASGDLRVPLSEGRLLASQIPNAQFIQLNTDNHILLHEPSWELFMLKLNQFLF